MYSIRQIREKARATLSPELWDYLVGGAGEEVTLRRNRYGFQKLALRAAVLRDVAAADAASTVLGIACATPVFLSPIGSLGLFDARGALASAEAVAQARGLLFYGVHSETSPQEVIARAQGRAAFQLYLRGGLEWRRQQVRLAEELGFAALCVTVDTPVIGLRWRDIENRFDPLSAIDRPNLAGIARADGTAALARATWDDIRALREMTKLPFVLKGIQTVEDAERAVSAGAGAIYVSNHGGRQLDHTRGAIEMLPDIAAAVAGRADILFDGGVMSGTDVVKALLSGASAVGIGKLHGLSLAAGGAEGLVTALALLEREIVSILALLGVTSPAALHPSLLERIDPLPATDAI